MDKACRRSDHTWGKPGAASHVDDQSPLGHVGGAFRFLRRVRGGALYLTWGGLGAVSRVGGAYPTWSVRGAVFYVARAGCCKLRVRSGALFSRGHVEGQDAPCVMQSYMWGKKGAVSYLRGSRHFIYLGRVGRCTLCGRAGCCTPHGGRGCVSYAGRAGRRCILNEIPGRCIFKWGEWGIECCLGGRVAVLAVPYAERAMGKEWGTSLFQLSSGSCLMGHAPQRKCGSHSPGRWARHCGTNRPCRRREVCKTAAWVPAEQLMWRRRRISHRGCLRGRWS